MDVSGTGTGRRFVGTKTRQEYWIPKLEGNKKRDRRAVGLLKREGWNVLVVWECETKNVKVLSKRLRVFLGRP